MGQGASSAGHNAEFRNDGSTKRQSKHRRSTRSLPDAALIRTTPAVYNNHQNGSRSLAPIDQGNMVPHQGNRSSSVVSHQQSGRRVGVPVGTNVEYGHNIPVSPAESSRISSYKEHCWREHDAMFKKYMHKDAAPYYVSTKAKPTDQRPLEVSFNQPRGTNSRKYKKSEKHDDANASSNWSDVASDMFRISKHHRHVDFVPADCSNSDVQSDFVAPFGNDRSIHRHNRGSSRRCQQMKVQRSAHKPGKGQELNTSQPRRDADGSENGIINSRIPTYRDHNGFTMTPVPENPYKEHQQHGAVEKEVGRRQERTRENVIGAAKRSKSVHDCAGSTRKGDLQPPSHPPPRPPKGKVHYYARLENEDPPLVGSGTHKKEAMVEQWIDFPRPQRGYELEASPEVSGSLDTPTPRSPGSSECDKLVIQSLRAELSAERSLRVDAERRYKNHDKETDQSRQRIRQLESEVQRLAESMEELRRQREEEQGISKKKMDELAEKCEQLTANFRLSEEEKKQIELRCSQERSSYDEYMDNVADQVGQALARQLTMKTECARLQKRLLEVEWENKVLKAQLRLTPTWAGASGVSIRPTNCLAPQASFLPSSAQSTVSGKAGTYVQQSVDHRNNNGNQTGIVYRRKSFREKMAGLHKYRQSMGSDPTLDQSGPKDTDVPAFSIESLASFNDENDPYYGSSASAAESHYPLDSSDRQLYPSRPSFPVLNAGEGLCSRPASLNFGPGASDVSKNNSIHFPNGTVNQQQFTRDFCMDPNENYEETPKDYTAIIGEGLYPLGLSPVTLFSRSSKGTSPAKAPLGNGNAGGSGVSTRTIGRQCPEQGRANSMEKDERGNDDNSSTETLNAGTSSLENGYGDSSKRKLDVVVNMLTSMDIRQPLITRMNWPNEKWTTMKTNQHFGYSKMGLLRDDGYSTMSSELYTIFDKQKDDSRSVINGVGDGKTTRERQSLITSISGYKMNRSMSDGQLYARPQMEKEARPRNGSCLSLGDDDGTLDEAGGDEDTYTLDHVTTLKRGALCDADVDFRVPSSNLERIYSRCPPSDNRISSASPVQSPPDPESAKTALPPTSAMTCHAVTPPMVQPRLSRAHGRDGRRKGAKNSRYRLSTSSASDSSSTDCGDITVLDAGCGYISGVGDASTSSTSATSEDEETGQVHIDEGAKTTMQLWFKQLKIKRAGQKAGLVRYMPPDCRPSILRPGVYSHFGTEERRALAHFDFLNQAELDSPPRLDRKQRSRSITDLYENLPYHQRTQATSTSLWGCSSFSTVNSLDIGDYELGRMRSYTSSLFLSDFCNDEGSGSSTSSDSSLSFT